MKVSEINR